MASKLLDHKPSTKKKRDTHTLTVESLTDEKYRKWAFHEALWAVLTLVGMFLFILIGAIL